MCSVKRLENQIIYWYVFESMKIEEPKQDSQEEFGYKIMTFINSVNKNLCFKVCTHIMITLNDLYCKIKLL
jgi:hypothetical protein